MIFRLDYSGFNFKQICFFGNLVVEIKFAKLQVWSLVKTRAAII